MAFGGRKGLGRSRQEAESWVLQMVTGITTALLVGALSAVPLAGGAAAGQADSPNTTAESSPPKKPVPDHAVSGVVKSVDATRLVITRVGKTPGEMTFVLSRSTEREGTIGVGATVQVRFRTEGHNLVATAIFFVKARREGEGLLSTSPCGTRSGPLMPPPPRTV